MERPFLFLPLLVAFVLAEESGGKHNNVPDWGQVGGLLPDFS